MSEEKIQHIHATSSAIYPIHFVQIGDHGNVPAPLVRISTCGGLIVEVLQNVISSDPQQGNYQMVTPQQRRKGSTTGRTLLSVLVSLPAHYAAKGWLTEKLCNTKNDENDEGAWSGMVRVDNIVTLLRGLLCPPGIPGEKEIRKALVTYVPNRLESGPGYQLASEPLLWLDVDVIEAAVKQACLSEQRGEHALPSWEQAYTLASKGSYLPDERYSDWARDKRNDVDGYLRQAVHALHRLYLARDGEAGEEQVLLLLRTYWQAHPTDEDILRPLVELLSKRGCPQEAEAYYHRLCQELKLEGRTPSLRTQHTMQNLRSEQHQQKQNPIQIREGATLLGIPSSTTSNVRPLLLPWSSMSLMFGESSEPVRVNTLNMMKSRRQLLHELLSTACTALVLSPYAFEPREKHRQPFIFHSKGDGLNFTILDDFKCITARYWRLCKNVSLDLLGSVTEHFQTITHQLKRKQSHEIAQCLCQLAGETAQIVGKTLFDLHEYALAWSYYTFSLKAAQAVSNHDLWAVGLGRMSLLLIYWEQPQDACSLLQEARQLTIHCPRTACWLAVVEAEVHAQLGDVDACDQALQAAKRIAAIEPLGEDQYAIGMDSSRLAGYEGACFVRLHHPERALPALQQAAALLDPQAIRRQSTIFSDMGKAYAQQGNIQEACTFAMHALTLTTQTRSLSVLERVRLVWQELEPWKETESVQALEEHLDAIFTLITT